MKLVFAVDDTYLDQMVQFQLAMALETEDFKLNEEKLRHGIKTQIERSQTGRYLLALEGEKLVGMLLTLFEWSDWRGREVIWIHSVYIDPKYRGQGIYKTMYSHVKELVEQNEKYAGIRLYVDKTNTKAQRVYEKLGMSDEHYLMYEWLK